MSTDYAPAIDLQDSRIGWGGWQPTNRRWIIVHGTAGDATVQAVQQTFINNAARGEPSSTHYAVGEDGTVAQYVPESGVAWGNGPITGPAGVALAGTGNAHDAWWDTAYPGNANPDTLSIEHCKSDNSNASQLTPAQQAASFALIAHLCERWNIPKRVYGTSTPADANGGITGHFSMDPVNRAFCPGAYPWQALQTYLEAPMTIVIDRDASGAIIGAHDTTNGNKVGSGFATFIYDNNLQSATISLSTDDPSKPQLASGVRIAVLRGTARLVLTWSATQGVHSLGGDIVLAVTDLYNGEGTGTPPVNVKTQYDAVMTQLNALAAALGSQVD